MKAYLAELEPRLFQSFRPPAPQDILPDTIEQLDFRHFDGNPSGGTYTFASEGAEFLPVLRDSLEDAVVLLEHPLLNIDARYWIHFYAGDLEVYAFVYYEDNLVFIVVDAPSSMLYNYCCQITPQASAAIVECWEGLYNQ